MQDVMILFDLDGTLWDASCNVTASWNEVIKQRFPGRKLITVDDMHSVMGKTMEEISDILFGDIPKDQIKNFYNECMEYENEYINKFGGTLFENEKQILSGLIDQGYRLAIVSNCQCGYIEAFLNSMGMSEYFDDFEEWGNTLKPKSENIRLVMERNRFTKGIYIGDTQKDGDSARDAKVPFILAGYGYGSDTAPDEIVNSFIEIPSAIKKIRNRLS